MSNEGMRLLQFSNRLASHEINPVCSAQRVLREKQKVNNKESNVNNTMNYAKQS